MVITWGGVYITYKQENIMSLQIFVDEILTIILTIIYLSGYLMS